MKRLDIAWYSTAWQKYQTYFSQKKKNDGKKFRILSAIVLTDVLRIKGQSKKYWWNKDKQRKKYS